MDELRSSLNDAIESCNAAITAVDPVTDSLKGAYESCTFSLQQGNMGSNYTLDSFRENLHHTYEPIATLIVAIESCEAAFAAVEAKYNAAIQVAAVGPNMALAIANLHHPSEHFKLVRKNIERFMIYAGLLFYSNPKTVIEENDTAKSAPVGPVVADMSEEHNTDAPEETAEHNTAAPKETAEHNRDLPDLDPIMKQLLITVRQLMDLKIDAVDPNAAEPVVAEETVETA